MDGPRRAIRGIAEELSGSIARDSIVGLGSGSTVASLLEEIAPIVLAKHNNMRGAATSTQIEMVAERSGITLVPFPGVIDVAIDGADQVDSDKNLIKGGGGALLKEKVFMASAKKVAVVASSDKFSRRLCEGSKKVPVEVAPFARQSVKLALSRLGGMPEERLMPKGYPYFTENGNVLLDTAFEPIDEPESLEKQVKNIPGVVEVGIFTVKPITVFRVREDGRFDTL